MRFHGLALVAAIATLSACGGESKPASDQSAATPTPAAGAPAGAATAMPVTGKTVEVKMVGDAKGYRFEPADITLKQGDAIKYISISTPPHNIAFQNVAADARAQLSANMPNQMSDLMGPMLLNVNDSYTVSFAGVKPGKYEFNCTPHLANNMKGTVTVQ